MRVVPSPQRVVLQRPNKGPCSRARRASPTRMGSDAMRNVRAGPPKRNARVGGMAGFQRHRLHPRIGVVEENRTRGVVSRTGCGSPGNCRGHGCPTLLLSIANGRAITQSVSLELVCCWVRACHRIWENLVTPRPIRQTSPEQPIAIIRLLLSIASLIPIP